MSELELAYEKADYAVTDAIEVLEEYLENGGIAADKMAGYPVFNNWQALQKISPLLSDRVSEVERIRKELGEFRDALQNHLNDADTVLRTYKDMLRRNQEAVEANNFERRELKSI